MASAHGPVISVNLYTDGDKLLKPGGSPYYGYYHVHQDGTYMTGKDHTPGVPMYELKLKHPIDFASILAGVMGKDQTDIPLTPDGEKLILEEDKLKKDKYKPITTQTVLQKYPNKNYQAAIDTSIYELIDIAAVAPIDMVIHPTQNWIAQKNEGKITCVIHYDIYLPCQATSTKNSNLTYKWMKDGEVVRIQSQIQSGVEVILPLKDIQMNVTGFWSCEISDTDGNIMISDGVYIDVIDPNELETFGGNVIKNGDAKQDLSYWQVIGPTQPVPLSLDLDLGRYNLESSVKMKGAKEKGDPKYIALPDFALHGNGPQAWGYDAYKWERADVFDIRRRDKDGISTWAKPTGPIGLIDPKNYVKPEDYGYRPDKNSRYFYGGWGDTAAEGNWTPYQQNYYSTMRQEVDLAEIATIIDAQNPAALGVPGGSGSIYEKTYGVTQVTSTLWGWLGSVGWTEHISAVTSHHTYNPYLAKTTPGPPPGNQTIYVNAGSATSVAGDDQQTAKPWSSYFNSGNYTNSWILGGSFTSNTPLNSAYVTVPGKPTYYKPNYSYAVESAPNASAIWWDYRHTAASDWQRTQVHDKVFVTIDFYDANESVLNSQTNAIQNYQYWNDLPHSLWYIYYTGGNGPIEDKIINGLRWVNVLENSRTSRTSWEIGPGWIDGLSTDAPPSPNIANKPKLPDLNLITKIESTAYGDGQNPPNGGIYGRTWDEANINDVQNGQAKGLVGNEFGSTYIAQGQAPGIDGGEDFTRTVTSRQFTKRMTADDFTRPWAQGVNIAGFKGYPYKHIHNKSRFFFSENKDIIVPPLTRKAVVTIKWERDPNRGFTYSRMGEKYNPNKYKGSNGSPPYTTGTYGLEFMCGATNIGAVIRAWGPNQVLTPNHTQKVDSGMSDSSKYAGILSNTGNTGLGTVDPNNLTNLNPGGPGAVGTTSDRKLKQKIKLIGKSPKGINIYQFEFIDKKLGEGAYQGVMADEVPEAAVKLDNEDFYRVNYSLLDVEFIKL